MYEEAANWYIKYFDHYYPQNDPPSPSEFVYQFGIMYDYRCSLQWSELETIFTQRWPEIFGTYIIQGWNYLFKGDSESAQIAFSKVTNDSEEAWIAHFGLGVTYANEKNGKAAVKCFEKALLSSEWAQKFFSLRYQYAWSLIDVKDYQKAEDQFRIILSIYGDQPDILDLLGYCLYKQKKYDEAIAVFGKTLELWDPQVYKGYSPYWTLARVFCRLKRYDDAIETLKHIGKDGKILKSALTEIQRIEKLKAKTSQSGLATEDEDEALDEFVETFSERLDERPEFKRVAPIHSEAILETFIEERINRGETFCDMHLSIYEDENGYGRQYIISGVGRIDLLAVEKGSKDLVVIELKRNESDDEVVGQISRYMAWVKRNLAKEGQVVKGIICVHKALKKLVLSASNIPGLMVYEYDFNFRIATIS
ncbi:MAG: endonuclease NucS domain-containing protein [Limnochordia bacterium]